MRIWVFIHTLKVIINAYMHSYLVRASGKHFALSLRVYVQALTRLFSKSNIRAKRYLKLSELKKESNARDQNAKNYDKHRNSISESCYLHSAG